MFKLKSLAQAASVAALTVGVAFVAQPAQKASAQIVGAGASSITTLADAVRGDDRFAGFGSRYVVTGSGAGRTAFINGTTNFVATDGLSNLQDGVDSGDLIALQEANLFVAFPYNVTFEDGTPFDVSIDGATACAIFNGDLTNWSEVENELGEVGPDLPIIRVARGDSSGTTDVLQGIGAGFGGFVDGCNAGGFDIPDIRGPRVDNFTDGTSIPNPNGTEIIVPAASVDGETPDPFGLADLNISQDTPDDDNSGSYSQGIINTIISTNGAIGYTETALARANGFVEGANGDVPGLGLAVDVNAPSDLGRTPTVASAPTFVVFSAFGNGDNTEALQNACLALTDTTNLAAAGFDPTPLPNFDNGEFGPDAADGGSDRCFEIGE